MDTGTILLVAIAVLFIAYLANKNVKMMKCTFLLTFLFLICTGSFAQNDSVVTFTETVNVESATQSDLFSRARMWADKNFADPKSAINISDKESGELTGKGIMKFSIAYQGKGTPVPANAEFRFSIRVKDGKYRYEFTDFDIVNFWNTYRLGILRSEKGKDWFGTKKWSEIAYSETKTEVEKNTYALIESLKKEMGSINNF